MTMLGFTMRLLESIFITQISNHDNVTSVNTTAKFVYNRHKAFEAIYHLFTIIP